MSSSSSSPKTLASSLVEIRGVGGADELVDWKSYEQMTGGTRSRYSYDGKKEVIDFTINITILGSKYCRHYGSLRNVTTGKRNLNLTNT